MLQIFGVNIKTLKMENLDKKLLIDKTIFNTNEKNLYIISKFIGIKLIIIKTKLIIKQIIKNGIINKLDNINKIEKELKLYTIIGIKTIFTEIDEIIISFIK